MLTALHILGLTPLPPVPAHAPVRQVRQLDGRSIAALRAAQNQGASRSCRERADMLREAVVAYLREAGEPVTRGELIDVLQAEPRVVSSRLTDLARQGIVQHMRVHRDVVWSLVESGK